MNEGEQLRHLRRLLEVLGAVTQEGLSSLDTPELYQRLLGLVVQGVKADAGAIRVLDPGQGVFKAEASLGLDLRVNQDIPYLGSREGIGALLATGKGATAAVGRDAVRAHAYGSVLPDMGFQTLVRSVLRLQGECAGYVPLCLVRGAPSHGWRAQAYSGDGWPGECRPGAGAVASGGGPRPGAGGSLYPGSGPGQGAAGLSGPGDGAGERGHHHHRSGWGG